MHDLIQFKEKQMAKEQQEQTKTKPGVVFNLTGRLGVS